jgi:hypothetical protein
MFTSSRFILAITVATAFFAGHGAAHAQLRGCITQTDYQEEQGPSGVNYFLTFHNNCTRPVRVQALPRGGNLHQFMETGVAPGGDATINCVDFRNNHSCTGFAGWKAID